MDVLGRFMSFVILAAICAATFAARADYPIVSQRYAADPAGVEFNGRLYLYCSNDDENGTNGYLMSSITCFSTDDLKNWTDHGVVFRATNTSWATLAWAPSAVSNQSKVFLYFANGAGSIGVATSSGPSGPFTDARGSALINSSTPGAATSTQWYFDPCAFVDDDGQSYLYFGGQYPTNARFILLNTNLTSVSGSAMPMFATNFFEASYIHKRNGIYYYTYCNRFEFGAAIYCETNSNPTNGFVPQGTVLGNPPQNVYNNNHHAIVSYLGNWYIAYHNRAVALQNGLSNSAAVYKRSLCLDAINYNPDGSIQQVTPTTDGLAQLKNLDPFKRVEAETIAQQSGIRTEVCSEGGLNVTSITNGSWIRTRGVNFRAGAATFYARVAGAGGGGNIELRLDSLAGTLIGTCAVAPTGGGQKWTTVACDVSDASGVHDLYLKFTGGAGELFNLNWWQFQYGASSGGASSVTFEAESGVLGSNFTNGTAGAVQFISTSTDTVNSGNPGNANRVAAYTITFPAPGTYNLFARLRVGPGGFNDDSLFYADSFGTKSSTLNSDWILVNGLGGVGFSNSTDVVTGGGSLGSGMWKWINLSQFTGQPGFTVSAGNLTQTFQIGARENGLDLDKFAFGMTNSTFTVSDLDAGAAGLSSSTNAFAQVVTTNVFQTIEGFGGAIAFYNGWVTAHPYKLEIYTNAFAGLNLSMLRLGNWYRYQTAMNFDPDAVDFVSNANRILHRPLPVYMSSWAPPAFLKSNGQVGNGGTLLYTNGGFVYNEFAQYWYDSLQAYRSNGVSPTWISIQNEPDFEAGYDSCVLRPSEGVVNGTNYASYAKALEAVYNKLTNLPAPPKLLAPEVVHIRFNTLANYAATMNPNHFYGVAYHLYGDSTDGTMDGYTGSLRASTNYFPGKPHFMTEYGVSNMIDSATLIHNTLTEGMASGYNHWSLVWPGTDGGLIQIEYPWNQAQWTNAPPGTPTQSKGYWLSPSYWSMKHFSYFITPGSRRIAASCTDTNVHVSAYVTADNLRLVTVFINRSTNTAFTFDFDAGTFPFVASGVYQTAGTNKFQSLGPVGAQLTLPAQSLTTVVLEKFLTVGPASNPSPAVNAAEVGVDAQFSWSPGSNAVTHAVYLGFDSNAVAQATPGSPEFKGFLATNVFSSALLGSATYFWRVDESAGANTNTGPVWSFSTAAAPATTAKVEAEAGTPGADWGVSNSSSPAYLTISTDSTGNNPGSVARVATYTVAFPGAGTYSLYARIRVWAGGYADDSLFYGNGFGSKSPTVNANWILVNGLAGAGYNNSADVVTNYASGGGSAGNLVWKWVNLSQFTAHAGFTVPVGNLVQTFQLGGRENGLDLDKFVFGETNYTYTVAQLDAALEFNQSPSLAALANQVINPGMTLVITNIASDPDLPGQTLVFTLLNAPTNATLTALNSTNALFTWRPFISQADSTDTIRVKVTDDGTPGLSATNNFVITVNPVSPPALSSIALGSQVSLSATGMIGPDYTLLVSSNLMNWQMLFVTNPAAMPVTFTDTNRNDAARFYRLQLGP